MLQEEEQEHAPVTAHAGEFSLADDDRAAGRRGWNQEGQDGAAADVDARGVGRLKPVCAECYATYLFAWWHVCLAAPPVAEKIQAIICPIMAFAGLGFEHLVANMHLVPIGAMQDGSSIGFGGFLSNFISVTLVNMVGGGALVPLVYCLVYLTQDAPLRGK